MSDKHLTVGSQEPPRNADKLRVYSMLFCPYAQRARLVVKVKGVPHDIVNINLSKKPEWYLKINPEGKVPALLDGDKIVTESLDIADYLDEKYPQNPLYPSDPATKQKDKELIQKIGPVTGIFGKCLYLSEQKSPEEWIKLFLEVLKPFEDELARRGTFFFGGDKPGMVDYMLWPWGERAPLVAFKFGKKELTKDTQIPLLRQWRKAMRQNPVVSDLYIPSEKSWKFLEARLKGEAENPYDNL